MPGFTHLHTVSGFSLRYGASHPERLAERAAERGMDALALTDRDTLAGTVRFAKACAKAGVRPLFGVDLAVTAPERPQGDASSARRDRRRTPVRGGAFVDESAPRVTFLARDGARGWADLCRWSRRRTPADGTGLPSLPWADNHGDGLTVLLGPASDVGRALAAGRPDRAARLLAPWREAYGDALRLEAVWHGRTGTGPGSLRLAARTARLRRRAAASGPCSATPSATPTPARDRSPTSWTRPADWSPSTRAKEPRHGRALAQGRGRRCSARPSGSPRPRVSGGTPPTGCSSRPGPRPPSAWSTPRTTSAWAPSTSPSRISSARTAAPPSGCWPHERRPGWCCAATTGREGAAVLGADARRAATSSPTSASPRTS